jgi:hypothetical protein
VARGEAPFTLDVIGLDRRLGSVVALRGNLYPSLHRTVYGWAQDTRAALKSEPYPPRPPNSTYRRTGQLANRWAVVPKGPDQIMIRNAAYRRGTYYSVYVVGDAEGRGQAGHMRHWWLARNVVYRRVPALRAAVGRTIGEEVRKAGLR